MEWRGEGMVLAARPHGESAAILEVFTEARGRHAGIVHGGTSRKLAPLLQPGAQVALTWRARLEEHLGTFSVEPVRSRMGAVMGDRIALEGLNATAAMLSHLLPERDAHPRLYLRSLALLDMLGEALWPLAYLRWEESLLGEMGFGLDLERCAVTGTREGLAYVSPRTGRAVTSAGAGEFADRLLPLPPVLRGTGGGAAAEVLQGLEVTGWFLEHRLSRSLGERPLPAARARLLAALARAG
ncbi:DNA repair protein RecO [Pseudoroseicyclus aestuarii]|uniref:DNA repair protein RecO n=1 Tax=Pseudoroseicyclus aestuarii TaxID=1795041 RepID=UPI000DA2242B|nr:DNA repair protein RecO [Pseudoroseicyclus aestuarii]